MKKEKLFEFKEGQYVYCSRIRGIHKVLNILSSTDGRPPILILEHLYNEKYKKIGGKFKDRENTVDGTYCRPINLVELLRFETLVFTEKQNILNKLINDKK